MTHLPPAWVSRALVIAGFIGIVVGTIDPLEGSVAILVGLALVAVAAHLRQSRHRHRLSWSAILVALGVAAMFILSAMGGVGGTSGRSWWWALVILPYPVGWLIGVVESIRFAREPSPA